MQASNRPATLNTKSLDRKYEFMGMILSAYDMLALQIAITICSLALIIRYGYPAFLIVTGIWILYLFGSQDRQEVTNADELAQFKKDNSLKIIKQTGGRHIPPIFIGQVADEVIIHKSFGWPEDDGFRISYITADIYKTESLFVRKHYFAIEDQVNGRVPEVVIDSIGNSRSEVNLARLASDFEELHFEGDFSNYYRVYCPSKAHIAALSLLTPDVMATLIDENAQIADVVLTGNKIWLVVEVTHLDTAKKVASLYNAYFRLMPEINHKAKSYRP